MDRHHDSQVGAPPDHGCGEPSPETLAQGPNTCAVIVCSPFAILSGLGRWENLYVAMAVGITSGVGVVDGLEG
jgi:hypothetical protein